MSSVVVRAPAKINLSLRVLGRRDDGFHDLETVFQAIGLYDTVEVAPASDPGVELTVEGAELGPVTGNLVWRGATAFLQWSGMQGFGVRIRLTKRIPVGAGLGGGSSDAAATLKGLGTLFGSPLAPQRLLQLAAALGSDVPFFMGEAGTALGRGRGEVLTALPALDERWVVVGMPPVSLATGEMYADLAASRGAAGGGAPEPLFADVPPASWAALAAEAVNDFQPLARERAPAVGRTLDAMQAGEPLLTLLSGSGASVFAVHGDRDRAEDAAARARHTEPEATYHVVPTLASLPAPEPAP